MNLCIKRDIEYGNDYKVDYYTLRNIIRDYMNWQEFQDLVKENNGRIKSGLIFEIESHIVFNTQEEARNVIDLLDPYLVMKELMK